MTTRSNAFFGGLIEGKQEENVPTKDVQMQTNAYSYYILRSTGSSNVM